MSHFPIAALRRATLLLGLGTGLACFTGCELLQSWLCDPESDPACEDPERGQLVGRIAVPAAAGAGPMAAALLGNATPPAAPHPGVARARALLREHANASWMPRPVAPAAPAARATPPAKFPAPVAGTAPQAGWKRAAEERWRPGEVIVRARAPLRGRKSAFASELAAWLGDEVAVEVTLCNTDTLCLVQLKGADGERLDPWETADRARRIARHSEVAFAEVNRVLQAQRTPNDHLYPLQWHYGVMRLPTAWSITTGSDDVVAAVIDTGILSNHPDLAGRVVGGADLIDDPDVARDGDGRDEDGYDPGDQACGGECHSYHGTHVAGTMAARTDNAQMVAGVSWAGQLLAVRVLGKGGGSLFDIIGGIYWAIGGEVDGVALNERPADVLNLSLGGRGDSEAMNEAVTVAVDAGAIVVVAAGNSNADATGFTPANAPDAITVAAVGNVGGERRRPRRTSYSNFGPVVDIAAPGGEQAEDVDQDGHADGVLSTLAERVEFYQGTSMAAPHVAGLAMLMRSLQPSISAAQARRILRESASQEVDCEGCGAGLVNAAQALRRMQGIDDEPLVVPSPDIVRLGRGDGDAELAFVNEGGRETEVALSLGGRDRDRVTLDQDRATLAPGQSLRVSLRVARSGDDVGEVVVSARYGDGAIAEARVLWSDAIVTVARAVAVGAFRIEGDDILPERIVTASAADEYDYKLFNLTPGEYLVIGLSDDDNDGAFEDHEGVGVYPRIQEAERVTVRAGETREQTDFLVAPSFVYEEDPGRGDGDIGAACARSSDCLGALYCEPLFVGGYCTRDCSLGNACPAGSDCFCLDDGTGACGYLICLETCEESRECREDEGYVCDADATCYPG